MSVTICHASIDERGRTNSGQAGDQTGTEVCTRAWYNKPWNVVLRCNDQSIAKKAAEVAKKLANSNLVGYDQYERNTLYKALKKNNWDVDAYIRSGVKTETDCSAFMFAVYCCFIPSMRSDSNAPTTSTMRNVFKNHGFTVLTGSQYVSKDSNLLIGDVLVNEGHHTAMAVTNGSYTTTTQSTTKTTYSGTAKFVAGKTYTTQANLNIRTAAGITSPKKNIASLSVDGRKHAYTGSDGKAVLRSGTAVTCQSVQNIGSDVWIKIPSGWIAAYYNKQFYVK